MKKIEKLILTLKQQYPDATCSLNFTTPFELAIAVMLSAQCTDARVNIVTKELFKHCNTPEGFCKMETSEIEQYIKSAGFYKNKAKNIKLCSERLVQVYQGIVPDRMEELVTLAGIGRKSANVILLNAFHKCEGIAVDTHALRISNRLGLSSEEDPLKVEQDLLEKIPKKYWPLMNHLFVYHGRALCTARNPKCIECPMKEYCQYHLANQKS